VLARVLSNHTDVLATQNTVQKSRYNLRLAQITPVPDVDVRLLVQKDHTAAPFLTATSLQVSVPVPVWDCNKGNIIQAQANFLRCVEEADRVRRDLYGRLAEACKGYEDNRILLDLYRTQILPDQVQAFRGAVVRHWGLEPEKGGISYNDLITAEQN